MRRRKTRSERFIDDRANPPTDPKLGDDKTEGHSDPTAEKSVLR